MTEASNLFHNWGTFVHSLQSNRWYGTAVTTIILVIWDHESLFSFVLETTSLIFALATLRWCPVILGSQPGRGTLLLKWNTAEIANQNQRHKMSKSLVNMRWEWNRVDDLCPLVEPCDEWSIGPLSTRGSLEIPDSRSYRNLPPPSQTPPHAASSKIRLIKRLQSPA